MEAVSVIVAIAFVVFVTWFTYKQIEFFALSVNLYRKIVERQDNIVSLLFDIRDGTKQFKSEIPEVVECPFCSTNLRLTEEERQVRTFNCAKCGKEIKM